MVTMMVVVNLKVLMEMVMAMMVWMIELMGMWWCW